ncbi:transcription factor PAR1-like [Carica papaya]|uniref:transcription factor PAR1-like n=1 Tax=Carica papaya TaxID=3649 RepID=UPI000B8D1B29|nr:transcription factor PAR1-like [Carica papaya]
MESNGYCKEELISRVRWSRRRRTKMGRSRPIQIKVRKLQKLIPGGEGLQPDRLFTKTADYILLLRLQVKLLQTLANIYKP